MSGKATGWAWDQKGLAPRTKMVLLAIADFCDIHGYGTRPRSYIAEQAECSVDTVDRCLKELESAKLVFVDRGENEKGQSRGQSTYMLAMHPAAKLRLGSDDVAADPSREIAAPQPHPDAADPAAYCAAPNNGYSNGITSSSSPSREEPKENPSKVDWQARLAEAHRIADGSASMANGGTCHPAAFRRLCEPTVGEPCDWDLDVCPAIASKAAAAKKRGKPILDWSWIAEQAIENRDRRLAGLPAPEAQPMRIEGRRKETAAEKAARLYAQMEGNAA